MPQRIEHRTRRLRLAPLLEPSCFRSRVRSRILEAGATAFRPILS